MIHRFAKLPASLEGKARTVRLGPDRSIPALLVHPNWIDPVPTVLWMHGRTAHKELDAGRYVRWMKAGIAACAIDAPAHGERADPTRQSGRDTLGLLAELIPEIDAVVESLADPIWQNVFDLDRLGIGGMSLGGMATLRRLCDPHPFLCAAVESTTGDLAAFYTQANTATHSPDKLAPLDPARHLAGFKPLPLLALHSEADRLIPFPLQQAFLDRLRAHYTAQGADPGLIELHTWPTTGAPHEHSGFGRVGNEAKNLQTEFLVKALLGRPQGRKISSEPPSAGSTPTAPAIPPSRP
jgi:alpha-beta hydrolase superfamily lysophospholipase